MHADPELVDAYTRILRAGYEEAAGEATTEELDARGLASILGAADHLAGQLQHSILDAPWLRSETMQLVEDWLSTPGDLALADLRDTLGAVFSPARALMIARTETAGVFNSANAAGLRAHGWTQVEWIAGDDACDDCAALDGQVMSLGEYEANPILHPNCACSCAPAEDEADQADEEEEA